MTNFYDTENFWVLHHPVEGYAKSNIKTTNKISYALKFNSKSKALSYKNKHSLSMFTVRYILAEYNY